MNCFAVWSLFVGLVTVCWSQEQSYNERTVCGGNLRSYPTGTRSRHNDRRLLRVITKSLHSARDMSEAILSYYVDDMNIWEGDITETDSVCAGALIPEIENVVTFVDMSTDITTDYRKLVAVLSTLNFVKSHTHASNQNGQLLRLSNVIHDVLCAMNNFGHGAGISLPRVIHIMDISLPEEVHVCSSGSAMTVLCDINTIYDRTKLDHEIIRLSKLYFDHMFRKYINFNGMSRQ